MFNVYSIAQSMCLEQWKCWKYQSSLLHYK